MIGAFRDGNIMITAILGEGLREAVDSDTIQA
jgi:hypothetical protein